VITIIPLEINNNITQSIPSRTKTMSTVKGGNTLTEKLIEAIIYDKSVLINNLKKKKSNIRQSSLYFSCGKVWGKKISPMKQ
jgi:hypothetical protein